MGSWLRKVLLGAVGGRQEKERLETHLGPLNSHSRRPRFSLNKQKDKSFLRFLTHP